MKTRLGGQWWGLLWTVGEPLAAVGLMLWVYGVLRARSIAGVDTLLFLVTGLLPYQLFKAAVLRLMDGIDANHGLFAYRQVRPIDAVFARAGVELTLAFALGLLTVGALAWLGLPVLPARPLELLAASMLTFGLGATLGLLAAVATGGLWTRARAVVRIGFFPLFLASGVVFPLASLPDGARQWLLLNPLLHLCDALRQSFFGDAYRAIPGASLGVPAAWLLATAPLALALYRVRRDQPQPA